MKVVLLAGGMGTRISEETDVRPKPMIEIGGKPILWHIMKTYSHCGFNDFVVCLGYKSYYIKEYFANYFLHQADITIDFKNNKTKIHQHNAEPWTVTLVDTGLQTMTGGRLKRVQKYLDDKPFFMTYGDGLADVNMKDLLSFHEKSGKAATLTAIQPAGRFGALDIGDKNQIHSFREKPVGDGSWINGGFFILEPSIFKYLKDDTTIWEREPLESLAREEQLNAYRHSGFWKCMDTLRDKLEFEKMWEEKHTPWKVWQ